MKRYLIVNADDFGQTAGINRGIIECHQRGIVTSTSLMVTGKALDEAVKLSRENPKLAIGCTLTSGARTSATSTPTTSMPRMPNFSANWSCSRTPWDACPRILILTATPHREEHLFDHFKRWVAPLNIPLRGDGRVKFVGGFYAQWEWGVTELKYVSVPFPQRNAPQRNPSGRHRILLPPWLHHRRLPRQSIPASAKPRFAL
jgi:hypothetical protein